MTDDESDVAYLDTMDELLQMVVVFAESARHSQDDASMGAYLKMASRCMRCVLELYGEHLAQNLAEMKKGEKVNE